MPHDSLKPTSQLGSFYFVSCHSSPNTSHHCHVNKTIPCNQANHGWLLTSTTKERMSKTAAAASQQQAMRIATFTVVGLIKPGCLEHAWVPQHGPIWRPHQSIPLDTVFMKQYPLEGVASGAVVGSKGMIDPKTYRRWIWPVLCALSDFEPYVVSFVLKVWFELFIY